MSSALDSTSPPKARPRHLGLPRRQSYDLLSTSTSKASLSQALSLGNLPSPTFSHIPAGQRSVPAVEMNRMLGHDRAFRSISGPLGDGQRTPGGSLVVGAEIFGFGGPKAKDRWTSTSIQGEGSDAGGSDAGHTPRSSAAIQLEAAPAGWPSEIEQAVASKDHKSHQTLEGSGDFTLTGLPRPTLKTAGSALDLRSSSFASSTDMPVRVPSRPNATRAKSGLPFESGKSSLASSAGRLPDIPLEASIRDAYDSSKSYSYTDNEKANGAVARGGYQAPDSFGGEYFAAASQHSLPQQQSATHLGPNGLTAPLPTDSPDELAFGLQGVHLDGGVSNSQQHTSNGRESSPSNGSLHAREAPPPPSRQSSGGFTPYFPPYLMHQDPYSSAGYEVPSPFFGGSNPAEALQGRRDSGYAPSATSSLSGPAALQQRQYASYQSHNIPQLPPWALPPPPTDFPPSNHTSRHGSFSSFSPAMAYGLAPGGFGASPLDQGIPVFQPAQIGQQHQIILGRGLRSSAEYIAPGPVPQNYPAYGGGYGHGYGAAETMGRALRSATLEEFRTSRHRVWELSDIVGHFVEFSGDQLGSRHIQTKLDTATAEEKALVFEELLPNMLQLSTDVFANYVVQKFFEQANQLQKTAMANVLEGHVLQLSLQMYGCRVVQKALEYVLVDQQVRLIRELDGHVLKCARDAQSNHVIQRAIERVPSDKIRFITDACIGQVNSLATHPYGCRVLQRIFENCPPPQTRTLLDELHQYVQNLIQDQYGNYVVQWVIEKGDAADRSLVINKVYGQVLMFAQQKFASNVVEKCVLHGNAEERRRIIDEVIGPAPDGSSVVKAMLVHPYANYVMQKILHIATSPQREQVYAETATQLANLRKFSTNYSKHLITIEKLLSAERARGGVF